MLDEDYPSPTHISRELKGSISLMSVSDAPERAYGEALMPVFGIGFIPEKRLGVIYPKKLAISQKMCHAARRFQRMGFLS